MTDIYKNVLAMQIVKLGIGNVIEALEDHGHWAIPGEDLNPRQLLVYVTQVLDAKEITGEEITSWVENPVIEVDLIDSEPLDVPMTGSQLWEMVEDQTTECSDTEMDLYSILGVLLEPEGNINLVLDGLAKNGIEGFQTIQDTGHVNRILVDLVEQGTITLNDIFGYLNKVTVKSSLEQHYGLLAILADKTTCVEVEVNCTLLNTIVNAYMGELSGEMDPSDHFEIEIHSKNKQLVISETTAVKLATGLRNRGLYVKLNLSPKNHIDRNSVYISLTDGDVTTLTPLVVTV